MSYLKTSDVSRKIVAGMLKDEAKRFGKYLIITELGKEVGQTTKWSELATEQEFEDHLEKWIDA